MGDHEILNSSSNIGKEINGLKIMYFGSHGKKDYNLNYDFFKGKLPEFTKIVIEPALQGIKPEKVMVSHETLTSYNASTKTLVINHKDFDDIYFHDTTTTELSKKISDEISKSQGNYDPAENIIKNLKNLVLGSATDVLDGSTLPKPNPHLANNLANQKNGRDGIV